MSSKQHKAKAPTGSTLVRDSNTHVDEHLGGSVMETSPSQKSSKTIVEQEASPLERSPVAISSSSSEGPSLCPISEVDTTERVRDSDIDMMTSEILRLQAEEEESIRLARMLMAEEAMASYAMSADYLLSQPGEYSQEDLVALRAAMADDDELGGNNEQQGHNSRDMSYDSMLRLGERIGDVKKERWTMEASDHISKLPQILFDSTSAKGKDENDSSVKCLVCQCPFEDGDKLRELPCSHFFHTECVDEWLARNDNCPYCRQSILSDEPELLSKPPSS